MWSVIPGMVHSVLVQVKHNLGTTICGLEDTRLHGHCIPWPRVPTTPEKPHLPALTPPPGAPDALAVSTDPALLRGLVDGSALRGLCARCLSLRVVSWRPTHVVAGVSAPPPPHPWPRDTAPCGWCSSLCLSGTLTVNVAALVSPVLLCSVVTPRSLLGATDRARLSASRCVASLRAEALLTVDPGSTALGHRVSHSRAWWAVSLGCGGGLCRVPLPVRRRCVWSVAQSYAKPPWVHTPLPSPESCLDGPDCPQPPICAAPSRRDTSSLEPARGWAASGPRPGGPWGLADTGLW